MIVHTQHVHPSLHGLMLSCVDNFNTSNSNNDVDSEFFNHTEVLKLNNGEIFKNFDPKTISRNLQYNQYLPHSVSYCRVIINYLTCTHMKLQLNT
jgi:hypothetical protein